LKCKTVCYEHQSQNLNKIIVNNDVQMSVRESCPEGIQIRIVFDHRPLTVFVESFCFAEGATGTVDVDSGETGGLLGWSGIFSISFFASSHAFKFFLHQSRWLLAMLIHISLASATFCRWNLSKSAWIVELEYLRS